VLLESHPQFPGTNRGVGLVGRVASERVVAAPLVPTWKLLFSALQNLAITVRRVGYTTLSMRAVAQCHGCKLYGDLLSDIAVGFLCPSPSLSPAPSLV